MRIDKWLWATRCFKTRTRAADACRGAAVKLNGQNVKPSASVAVGDTLVIRRPELTRTVVVRALLEKRVGAAAVPDYLDDVTPEEARQEALERRENARLFGGGRPSKRDRREIERLLGPED